MILLDAATTAVTPCCAAALADGSPLDTLAGHLTDIDVDLSAQIHRRAC